MSDPIQDLQKELSARETNVPRRAPAIRTMKTDIQELFQKTKPSFIHIVGQEIAARTGKEERGGPRWIRSLVAVGLIGTLTAAIALSLSWWLRAPASAPLEPTNKNSGSQLFSSERTLEITAKTAGRIRFGQTIEAAVKQGERAGTITRIAIALEDGPQVRPATLADFFGLYRIRPPQNFLSSVEQPFMPFVYHGGGGGRLGLAARVRDADRTLFNLLAWEKNMLIDLGPFFFGEKPGEQASAFEDRTYRNIDWRFLKLSADGSSGIAYAVFPAHDVFILTTSRESLEKTVDRLFEVR